MSDSQQDVRLRALLVRARHELACQRCQNDPRGVSVGGLLDECPECHGEFRNPDTIELLTVLVERAA